MHAASLLSFVPASVIGNGSGNVPPDVFTAAGLGGATVTLLYSSEQPFSFDGNTGYYQELVFAPTDNPFCAGCLGFGFTIFDESGPYTISTMQIGWWNSQTDVGYCTDCTLACDPGVGCIPVGFAPSTVYRDTLSNVGFNFTGTISSLGSDVLIVLTDAQSFSFDGVVSFVDSNAATSPMFGGIAVPAAEPAPEPATITLTGMALLGLASLRRRSMR